MNRFKNIDHSEQYLKDWRESVYTGSYFQVTISSIFGDEYGERYQDLYDLLADDYRGGYHGDRKLKLLLYIQHRAYREYGVIIHTGSSRIDCEDNHFSTPDVMAGLCDDYDSYEREEVQEFLAGIR